MKNKFREKYFLKIRKPHEKYQWWCPNIARRSLDESGKKSKSWIFEVRTLWDVYGCYMYALETWYVVQGHGIWCMDVVYVFWRWNMLYGHGICFLVMEYIFLIWNRFSWSHVRWYDMIWYDIWWYDDMMIWYCMMLFKTFEACVRLAAGAFFLEKTHILKKMIF